MNPNFATDKGWLVLTRNVRNDRCFLESVNDSFQLCFRIRLPRLLFIGLTGNQFRVSPTSLELES